MDEIHSFNKIWEPTPAGGGGGGGGARQGVKNKLKFFKTPAGKSYIQYVETMAILMSSWSRYLIKYIIIGKIFLIDFG